MMIKTETTLVFHYPEERDAEIAFSHDNDMSEWIQTIKDGNVSYTKISKMEVDFNGYT